MKYRKKPVVIEAIQWTGRNMFAVSRFCRELVKLNTAENPKIGFHGRNQVDVSGNKVLLYTLEGMMTANAGDWIIKGVNGEYYPCKPDIFEKTYEPVEEPDDTLDNPAE